MLRYGGDAVPSNDEMAAEHLTQFSVCLFRTVVDATENQGKSVRYLDRRTTLPQTTPKCSSFFTTRLDTHRVNLHPCTLPHLIGVVVSAVDRGWHHCLTDSELQLWLSRRSWAKMVLLVVVGDERCCRSSRSTVRVVTKKGRCLFFSIDGLDEKDRLDGESWSPGDCVCGGCGANARCPVGNGWHPITKTVTVTGSDETADAAQPIPDGSRIAERLRALQHCSVPCF